VAGIATVMVSTAVLPAGTSTTGRLTVVQVDKSSAVRAGASPGEGQRGPACGCHGDQGHQHPGAHLDLQEPRAVPHYR
jgi:hypothetical protein